jgi:hypothetical protein
MDLNGIILRNNIHKLNNEFISINNTRTSNKYDESKLNQTPDTKKTAVNKSKLAMKTGVSNTGDSSASSTPLLVSCLARNNNVMNDSGNLSPKSRPLPTFFADSVHFSTKKERETPKLADCICPPKPPIKSCPPISRLRPQCKPDYDGARAVSFLNKKSQNDSG